MPDTSAARRWRPTGHLPPEAMVDARLQTHHAAQLVVSAGISYLERRDDDSHTNMEWLPGLSVMAGNVLSEKGIRFALRPGDLTLLVLKSESDVAAEFALAAHTKADADSWMKGQLSTLGFDPQRLTQRKHYEIPPHRVANGRPFALAKDGSNAELSAFFHDGWWLATSVRANHSNASEPRIWPHHFDQATLITVPSPPGVRRTIGVGISPGDDSYAQPYIYVGPNPYPPMDKLPPLALGQWHSDRWTGAVLTGSAFPGETGAERALTFTRQAVVACERAFAAM